MSAKEWAKLGETITSNKIEQAVKNVKNKAAQMKAAERFQNMPFILPADAKPPGYKTSVNVLKNKRKTRRRKTLRKKRL